MVISSDVGASKYILNSSKAYDTPTSQKLSNIVGKVNGLKVAPTYHVLRVWLDKPVASKLTQSQAVIETPQHPPINLLGVFDMLEEESKAWADQTGGSIVEFHLYNTPEFSSLTKEQIWASIREQAVACFAQTEAYELMKSANVLDSSLGRFNNFTSFEPGQAKHKPQSYEGRLAGIDNLFFAGDWVQFDSFPNALMERAVTTGIEAANGILLKDGVRQVAVKGANPHGPGIFPRF